MRKKLERQKGPQVLVWEVIRQAFRDMGDKSPSISVPAILWIPSKAARPFFDLAGWDQRWIIERSSNPSWTECAQTALDVNQHLNKRETKFLHDAMEEIASASN